MIMLCCFWLVTMCIVTYHFAKIKINLKSMPPQHVSCPFDIFISIHEWNLSNNQQNLVQYTHRLHMSLTSHKMYLNKHSHSIVCCCCNISPNNLFNKVNFFEWIRKISRCKDNFNYKIKIPVDASQSSGIRLKIDFYSIICFSTSTNSL